MSLAVQTLDMINKLYSFYEKTKDVPDELHHLSGRLDSLKSTLADLAAPEQLEDEFDETGRTCHARKQCEEKLNALLVLLRQWESGLREPKWKKLRTSAKIVGEQGKLDK